MKNRLYLILFTLLITGAINAQKDNHDFKRDVSGVTDQWHKIKLPVDLFEKVNRDFSDIRVLGINGADTSEAPYLIERVKGGFELNEVDLEILNSSYNSKGHYYTLKASKEDIVNRIELNFSRYNFDWRVKIEGSMDQEEWFTLTNYYRIVSIHNTWANYDFTQINFPPSNYKYYRVLVKSTRSPFLRSATLKHYEFKDAKYYTYDIVSQDVKNDKVQKETIIDFELSHEAELGYLKLQMEDELDFYRPIRFQYLQDSVKTEKGWHYNYRNFADREVLSSFHENEFFLDRRKAKHFRAIISNHDNEPLHLKSITAKSEIYELITRLKKDTHYSLFYGNKNLRSPIYELTHLTSIIPDSLKTLDLGEEIVLKQEPVVEDKALVKNELWLWVIMGIIIVVLGLFSVKMIRGNNE